METIGKGNEYEQKLQQAVTMLAALGVTPKAVAKYVWLQDLYAQWQEEVEACVEAGEPNEDLTLQDYIFVARDMSMDDARDYVLWDYVDVFRLLDDCIAE